MRIDLFELLLEWLIDVLAGLVGRLIQGVAGHGCAHWSHNSRGGGVCSHHDRSGHPPAGKTLNLKP
jgi:hypothetical protein